jgi:hypothetical protein
MAVRKGLAEEVLEIDVTDEVQAQLLAAFGLTEMTRFAQL